MYRLSADHMMELYESRYHIPIWIAINLGTIGSLVLAAGLLSDKTARAILALTLGFLGVFATSWESMAKAEKLDLKSALFRTAELRYKALAREISKQIVKRKAEYLWDPVEKVLIVPPFDEEKFIW